MVPVPSHGLSYDPAIAGNEYFPVHLAASTARKWLETSGQMCQIGPEKRRCPYWVIPGTALCTQGGPDALATGVSGGWAAHPRPGGERASDSRESRGGFRPPDEGQP